MRPRASASRLLFAAVVVGFAAVVVGFAAIAVSCNKDASTPPVTPAQQPVPPTAPAPSAVKPEPNPAPPAAPPVAALPTPPPEPAMPDVVPEVSVPAGGPTDPPPPNPTGLQIVLGEGEGGGPTVDRASVPPTTKLDDASVKALIARLPKLEGQAGDDVPFAFRERSLPAPRAGETVKTPFPPPVAPGAVATPEAEQGPLEVRRFGPEGDVPVAPQLSITFSQPMVAVTSHEELSKLPIPVQLTPSLEGEWKWVGTKTLTFDAKVRLPMSTEFKVTVPASTASATGGKLDKEVSWTFRTPAPRVIARWPGDYLPTQLRPVIALRFDQRIDEQAILPFVKVKYGAFGAERAVRLATEAELAADPSAKATVTGSGDEKGRAIAVIPVEDLPAAETFSIVLAAGAPSAEGPRKTDKDQTSSFQTYGPFKFKELHCGWNNNCPPLHPWSLEFTNGIDVQAFEPGSVTITPELPNARIEAMGNNVTISGASKGRTTYRINVKAGLKDIFGQVLEKDLETSVKVTKAEPILVTPTQKFILADPMGDGSISVSSINHQEIDVKLYRVSPKDFPTYLDYSANVTYKKDRKSPPGKAVWEKRVKIASVEDEMVETKIDLRPALEDGFGSVMLWIRPVIQPPDNEYYEDVRVTWVQRTQLAIDAIMDGETVYALVTSLQTGLPVDGADVSLQPEGMMAKSGAAGIAELALPGSAGQGRWLVASTDKDVVFLPENVYWNGGSSWVKSTQGPYVRWYVFDDRGLYRPKEQVRFKGWMRLIGGGKMPTVQGLDAGITGVRWTLVDSRGNEVAKGTSPVTSLGGFDGTITLPDTMNLGPARLDLVAEGASATGGNTSWTFQVQEFRRPEFEVSSVVSDGPFYVGGKAVVTTTAKYFAGGTLTGAKVDWTVSGSQTNYTPPNRWDYAFGSWKPWWSSESRSASSIHLNYEGTTDSAGTHRLELRFDSVSPPRPWSLTAQSTVQDVNRQTFSASSTLLVHPSDRYVGIKGERDFLKSGEPIDVSLIVTDIDGNLQPGVTIEVECVRLEWGYDKGDWTQEEKDRETCTVTSAANDVSCSFTPKAGGSHQIKARIKDGSGRANESQREFYVPGGKQRIEREIKEENVTLIPNKKEYAVGDTAEIFVTSPWPRADGLVTISVAGVVETQPITIGADGDGNSTVVKVKIQEGFMPDVRVRVDLTGEAERVGDDGKADPKLPKRPAHASGAVSLAVPPVTRTLTVKPVPAEADLPPGGQTQVAVTVTDHEGKPVPGAEVAIVVVDESVLALTGYRIGDPVATFYGSRYGTSRIHKLRGFLILDDPAALLQAAAKGSADGRERSMMKSMPMPSLAAPAMAKTESAGDAPSEEAPTGGGGGDAGGPIAVRKNFDPLALFAAVAPTDESGVATVQVTLPDNLTRYRITAVAVEGGKHFGLGDATLTARLPLMVRPSAPRFLNFGDTFELPIVLQNQTSAPMEVDVAVSALGVELSDGAGRKVTVPANDRVEVRFPAAVSRVGKARFQIGASTGKWSDAANIELPIWTPATTEAFATYGTIDKGAIAQPVKMPGDVFTQFGGLEVSTASTNLQALTDAVLYLVSYPFECSEQISSRILGIAALKDVLTAFKTEGLPSPAEMMAAVERDLTRLQLLQHDNGGFSFWKRSERDWPYLTAHVGHAMGRAKQKGFTIPDRMVQKTLRYLKDVRSHFPSDYPEEIRRVIEAYAIYARVQLGDVDAARARALVAEFGGPKATPFEAIGFLLPALVTDTGSADLVKELLRHLGNNVTETAGSAHFTTSYTDGSHLILHSDRRVDGILLDAVTLADEKSDLIPKLVDGLLAHRTKGRWGNTQENVFVLLALDRYFNTFEKVTPNFVARVWLGDQYAGDHTFKGRTPERHFVGIPMALLGDGDKSLVIQKDGAGRLYYRVGMRYAPKDLKLESMDRGFYVERTYEAVDAPDDVKKGDDGVWRVKAGTRVRVKLTMVAEARRYHVALVDPIPAGFEPLNPELLGSQAPRPEATSGGGGGDDWGDHHGGPRGGYWRWWGPWYEHENLRDERVEAFTSLLWGGVYTYSYLARATTPGNFVVPPAKAEEMYAPETFGRSASERVIIE